MICCFFFRREIIDLTKENSLLETNLDRKKLEKQIVRQASELEQINLPLTITPNGSNHDTNVSTSTNRNDRVPRKRSKSRSTQADFRLQLTFQQKLDIVISEYEIIRSEKINSDNTYEKLFDQLEVR